MKRFCLLIIAVLLALSVACTKAGTSETLHADEQRASAHVHQKASGDAKKVEHNYPPMVKVAGVIYVDTGYENAMATCGTADGE